MKIARHFIVFIALFILWIFASRNSNPLFLPKPEAVVSSFQTLIQNGMLIDGLKMSFWRITTAVLISSAVAIPLGLLITSYKILDDIITPVTSLMRYIPVTVFYPLLMMWLGIDENMKVAFLVCATFFYFLPTVILCIRETNHDLIDTAYTIGMNKFQVMFKVILPYSLPSILESFIMMYGIGWTYVIIVEVVNAQSGLGHIINMATERGRTDLVFVALFTIMFVSWIFDFAGNNVIKKAFKWKFAREVED